MVQEKTAVQADERAAANVFRLSVDDAMIKLVRGDILKAKADALVNTVNTAGVMGRGIALQFAKAFPDVLKAYEAACKRGDVRIGEVTSYDLNRYEQPHFVINFPTKQHWRGKSRMEFVEAGLTALVAEVRRLGVKSVAIPPLGCGLGGLDWREVLPRIERALQNLADVDVLIFEPAGTVGLRVLDQEVRFYFDRG